MHLSLTHGVTAGTQILTCAGERPASALVPGARIITRNHGALALRNCLTRTPIGCQKVVHIPAHAFGAGRPACDMDVLPDQPIVIRDWRAMALYGHSQARVAASRLVDGQIITYGWRKPEPMVALHFFTPSIIYANGLEILSAGLVTGTSGYEGGALSI
jgi:hypothetical protein